MTGAAPSRPTRTGCGRSTVGVISGSNHGSISAPSFPAGCSRSASRHGVPAHAKRSAHAFPGEGAVPEHRDAHELAESARRRRARCRRALTDGVAHRAEDGVAGAERYRPARPRESAPYPPCSTGCRPTTRRSAPAADRSVRCHAGLSVPMTLDDGTSGGQFVAQLRRRGRERRGRPLAAADVHQVHAGAVRVIDRRVLADQQRGEDTS